MLVPQLIAVGIAAALLLRICPRSFRWIILLVANLGFYAMRSLSGLPFLLITICSTYAGGQMIRRFRETADQAKAGGDREERRRIKKQTERRCRGVVFAVLLINFGILAVLKYLDEILGLVGSEPLGLLHPLGISFYTFQSAGYLLDVAGGKCKAERNILRLALFLSYFPQLIQGPISRSAQLLPQLAEPETVSFEGMLKAFLRILWGLAKKLILADRAMPFVNAVFDGGQYGGKITVLAVLLYSLQQYCDFSGGIDMVLGLSELMGVRLSENFRQPYFAVTLADFWRRWHISLGNWMRDYVFYPFALSKPMTALSKKLKKWNVRLSRALPAALGNILVFFLVGLWHGATANYILWGLYNGIILALSTLIFRQEGRPTSPFTHLLCVLRTFVIVNIGWFFDRADSARTAFGMIAGIFTTWGNPVHAGLLSELGLSPADGGVLICGTLLLFVVSLLLERGVQVREKLVAFSFPIRWLMFLLLIFSVLIFGIWGSGFNEASFLYYKF